MIIRDGKETISRSEEYHGISKLIGEKNDIYFNTYKSKLERVNAQMKFKNYINMIKILLKKYKK